MHSFLEVVIVQFLTLEKSLLSSCFHVCLLFVDSSQFLLFWQVFFFFTLYLLRFPWSLSSPQIPTIISHEVSRLFPQWENPLHNIHRHKYSMHYTSRTISYEENFHPRLSQLGMCDPEPITMVISPGPEYNVWIHFRSWKNNHSRLPIHTVRAREK